MLRYQSLKPISPGSISRLPPKQRKFWLKFWGIVTSLGLIGVVVIVFLTIISVVVFARDLPSPNKLTTRDVSLSTKIYDRNGKLLYDIFGNQNRALTKLEDLPPYIKQATIAIEDKDFYKHKGFSQKGFLRAIFNLAFRGKIQGGSTLTQQTVKNALLSPERTVTRKIKEFILSLQIEQRYSKDEILTIYLNEVPYGGTAYGIEAAAQAYFAKKAKDLTLTEAVILAGLPQKPTAYSPFGSNPKAYIARSQDVARRMREDEYISKQQEEEIKRELPNAKFAEQGAGIRAPHFVLYVRDLLVDQFGQRVVEQGGLQVTTSLDLELQDESQKIVAEEISKLKNLRVGNGAAIVTNPKTGEILAMVGSKDYFAKDYDGNVNVTLAKRQPGSSIKPVNYATAFKRGYTPSFLLMDASTEFPGGVDLPPYKPVNYDGNFRGPIQVRFALGNSVNIPAVKMLGYIGVEEMLKTADDMGFDTLKPTRENLERFGLSLTLGGGEVRPVDMAEGFGVFANGGVRVDPAAILEVKDSKGKTLFKYEPPSGKKVLSEEISFLISDILSDNNARSGVFGPRSHLLISGRTVAVKTGTTDDKRDNWTGGWTNGKRGNGRVIVVWVGNNDNSPMHPSLASGTTGAAPIWNRVIRASLKGTSDEPFEKPGSVVQVEVDAFAGGLPCPGYPTRQEFFIKGTEPHQSCLVQKQKDGKTYFVFRENDPVSTDGKNRWQEGIDAWIQTQSDERYHPPPELLAGGGEPAKQVGENDVLVNMIKPAPEQSLSSVVEIEAQVLSGAEIERVDLYIDGGFVSSKNGSEKNGDRFIFGYDFAGAKGSHFIEVKARNNKGASGRSDVTINVTS